MKRLLLLSIVVCMALVACNMPAQAPSTPTITLLTPTPVPFIPTVEPTEVPPATATLYPTGTPDPAATPTQIVPEALLVIRIDPEATDGVKVRSGPGYECPANDPNCNWIESAFPSDDPNSELFPLLTVDSSGEVAWCEYIGAGQLFTSWSACEFLQPANQQECELAEEQEIEAYLKPCD